MDRLGLQQMLEAIPGIATDSYGKKAVYYQPPNNIRMSYPAIRYERSNIKNNAANNATYTQDFKYQITVIDFNPDSAIVTALSKLPKIAFNRHYVADGLNHDVFELYL